MWWIFWFRASAPDRTERTCHSGGRPLASAGIAQPWRKGFRHPDILVELRAAFSVVDTCNDGLDCLAQGGVFRTLSWSVVRLLNAEYNRAQFVVDPVSAFPGVHAFLQGARIEHLEQALLQGCITRSRRAASASSRPAESAQQQRECE